MVPAMYLLLSAPGTRIARLAAAPRPRRVPRPGAAMRRGAGTGNSPERAPIQSGFGVITGREGRRMARMRKMRFAGPASCCASRRCCCPCGATTIRRGQGTSGCLMCSSTGLAASLWSARPCRAGDFRGQISGLVSRGRSGRSQASQIGTWGQEHLAQRRRLDAQKFLGRGCGCAVFRSCIVSGSHNSNRSLCQFSRFSSLTSIASIPLRNLR